MEDCIFCKIIAGEIPAAKVYEGEHVIAFADINPQAPYHYLIIPRRHVRDISSVGEENAPAILEMFEVAKKLAEEKGIDKTGFRTVINQGKNSGQVVFHLHMHLIGGRPMGWPPG